MKKFLLMMALGAVAFLSQAQTTTTADRVVARQAMYLRNRWIDSVHNDTTDMLNQRAIMTNDAIRRFVEARIAAKPSFSKSEADDLYASISGSGNYIQNQYAAAQAGNFWLTGNARASALVLDGVTSDPASAANGWLAYNQTTSRLRFKINGSFGSIPISDASGNYVFSDGSISVPGAGSSSQRFGHNASSGGSFSLAVGYSATASGQQSTAIGYGAVASGSVAFAMGYSAEASGSNDAFAVGSSAKALTSYTTAIGTGAQAKGDLRATAIGAYTTADGWQASAIGGYSYAPVADATAVGGGAQATTQGAVAIGSTAKATHTNSMALGWEAKTTKDNQAMIGNTKRPIDVTVHGSYSMWLKEPQNILASSIVDASGSLPYAAYSFKVSAIDYQGNESAANSMFQVDNPGGKNAFNVIWGKVGGAVAYRVYVGKYGAIDRYHIATDTTFRLLAYGEGDGSTAGVPLTEPTAIGVVIKNMEARFPHLAGKGLRAVYADQNGFTTTTSPPSTPASNADPAYEKGAFWFDDNYIYYKTSTGEIKRAALQSF